MKTSSLKASAIVMLIAMVFGWFISTNAVAACHLNKGGNDTYVYHSTKLNVNINMPGDWQNKVTEIENDQTITVSYNNPGAQPVFLYSVNKISEQTYMNIKDQLQGVHIVAQKDGEVYFVQFTDKSSLKGANDKEFKAIVANLNDVLANISVG